MRRLQKQKVYILPSKKGWLAFGFFIALITVGATYLNNFVFLLAFFLFAVGCATMLETHAGVKAFQIDNILSFEVPEGIESQVTVPVVGLPNWQYEVKLTSNLLLQGFTDESGRLLKLRVPASTPLLVEKVKLVVRSKYPFQLFTSWKIVSSRVDILIYPYKPASNRFSITKVESIDTQEGGIALNGVDEFRSVKPAEKHLARSRINWKVTARKNAPYINEFESRQKEIGSIFLEDIEPQKLGQVSHEVLNRDNNRAITELVFKAEDGRTKSVRDTKEILRVICRRYLRHAQIT
ncbi:MAG: hypothetical protein COT74_08430 [Bdellovibrionales bacterium CG10_big_fil_rev_8_21_14_0_10_45_34]|nr:MAG: hypothetical protein COT74_08430 [Bdellovibrionales bacterium CG10_big_fil_rev_8_21_14_0_10_45_34]